MAYKPPTSQDNSEDSLPYELIEKMNLEPPSFGGIGVAAYNGESTTSNENVP